MTNYVQNIENKFFLRRCPHNSDIDNLTSHTIKELIHTILLKAQLI